MNIPPLISRTPPPLPDDDDDDDDDEFGSYVIGDIIDNGSSDIFHSINGETLPSAYDFIQPGSVGPAKDNPEKIINFYKNGVDSPTTSSAKDHLPDVIPDCEPVVPNSASLCDDIVSNGKDVPSNAPGPSPTKSECFGLSNGVVGFAFEKLENESDSFARTLTVTIEKQVPSNEICSDTISTDQTTSAYSEPPEVISDLEDVPVKVDSSIQDVDDFTSFAFEKPTDRKQYFDEKVAVDATESHGFPSTESLNVFKPHAEPPNESPAVSDSDFTSFAFEGPIIEHNYVSRNGDGPGGEIKPCDSLELSTPHSYEAPTVPDVDDFTNGDIRVDGISAISDADEFTSFAFEKPVDQSVLDAGGNVAAGLSDAADVPSSFADPPDASTVPDVDKFSSFAFEKPVVHEDAFGGAGLSSAADFEADEFSDFADFQTSSEADFIFQEAAPVAELRMEDAVPAETVEEFDAALVGSIDSNTVWCRLRYLEETPALKYQWLSSSSNHRLLSALKIDSRNIFCGPWSRSSKILGSDSRIGHHHHDVPGAPSAGHHERCHLHEASGDPNAKPAVPDAHFDWEGSGLVNPLFSSAKDGEILHCDIGGIIGSQMSSEAADILKSLPDLSYMTKTYLVFKPLPVPL